MDKARKYVLSNPDSLKMIEELAKKDKAIAELIAEGLYDTQKDALNAVNKLVYDTANSMGVSIYDICFRTIPSYEGPVYTDDGRVYEQTVRLLPVEFDLERDDTFWKTKYFELKEKIRNLIEEK